MILHFSKTKAQRIGFGLKWPIRLSIFFSVVLSQNALNFFLALRFEHIFAKSRTIYH